MDLYRVFSSKDVDGQNRWYEQCKKDQRVHVQVLTRTKLGRVEWDYITLPSARNKDIARHSKEIMERLIAVFERAAGSRGKMSCGATMGHMDNILVERAPGVAREIADIYAAVLVRESA